LYLYFTDLLIVCVNQAGGDDVWSVIRISVHMLVIQELHIWWSESWRSSAFGTHFSRERCWKVHSHVTSECAATSAIKICEGRIKVLEGKGLSAVLLL